MRGGLLGVLIVLVLAAPASATVINVSSAANGGMTDNTQAGNCNVREAIQAANTNTAVDACPAGGPSDQINVPAGTFTIALNPGTGDNLNAAGDLDTLASLAIIGAGTEATILSGNSADRIIDHGTTSALELRDLSITNGATSAATGLDGGAIRADHGAVRLFRTRVFGNTALGNGGALDVDVSGGTTLVVDSEIDNNSALNGGGIYVGSGSLQTENALIRSNTAVNGGGLALTASNDPVTVVNTTISANTAGNGGGVAVSNPGGLGGTNSARLVHSTVTGNSASGDGGGVDVRDANRSLNLDASIIAANTDTGTPSDVTGTGVTNNKSIVGAAVGGSVPTVAGRVGTPGAPVDAQLGPLADNGGYTQTYLPAASSPGVDTSDSNVCMVTADDARYVTRPKGAQCDAGAVERVSDAVAPETTSLQGPTATLGFGVEFTFTGSDNAGGVTFECRFDAGSFLPCGSPRVSAHLPEGQHQFAVRARDGNKNVDGSPEAIFFVVDRTPPTTTLDQKPALISNDTAPVFDFSGNGTGSSLTGFRCFLDGVSVAPCSTGPIPVSGQGSHTFTVAAVDQAGNVDPTPESWTWTLDTVAPTASLSTQPPAVTAARSAAFTFTGDGTGTGVASFRCTVDNITAPCVSGVTYDNLADGQRTFTVIATDEAGNDSIGTTYQWIVDGTPPDTAIADKPADPAATGAATFTFSGDDGAGTGVAAFECKLDDGAFEACTSPRDLTGLANGTHTFSVRAVDVAGSADATPASYTWTVATPVATVTATATPTETPTVTATATPSPSPTPTPTPLTCPTVRKKLVVAAVRTDGRVRLRVHGKAKLIRKSRLTQAGATISRFAGRGRRVTLRGLAQGPALVRITLQLKGGRRKVVRVRLPACS